MTALILLRDWQESQIEFWKPIQGNLTHDVSSFGRVRRILVSNDKRFGVWDKVTRRRVTILNGGFLRTPKRSSYYVRVGMSTFGNRKDYLVHRLVASAFVTNPQMLPQVNHKNGIKADNRSDNLEWATQLSNTRHAVENGLRLVGERSDRSKIRTEDVISIRQWRSEGKSLSTIVKLLNNRICFQQVWRISRGECWAHVT